jgi:hypothetical protein
MIRKLKYLGENRDRWMLGFGIALTIVEIVAGFSAPLFDATVIV